MDLKTKLQHLKKHLLEETYNVNDIYFGLLVEVANTSLTDIHYLGGYDWKYTQNIRYKKITGLILKKLNDTTYQDIASKKCYIDDDSVEHDYRMKVGEKYIYSSSIIAYTEVFKNVFNQSPYLTKEEITKELKKYILTKRKK